MSTKRGVGNAMTRAHVNNIVLAESDETVVVEGNHYFPPASVNWDYFNETELTTGCPWKGEANYYTIEAGDLVLTNKAWTYHTPSEDAASIKDHVAFYPEVTVE